MIPAIQSKLENRYHFKFYFDVGQVLFTGFESGKTLSGSETMETISSVEG
jgi:hypothetical protein